MGVQGSLLGYDYMKSSSVLLSPGSGPSSLQGCLVPILSLHLSSVLEARLVGVLLTCKLIL